jgi:hypothetical protein
MEVIFYVAALDNIRPGKSVWLFWTGEEFSPSQLRARKYSSRKVANAAALTLGACVLPYQPFHGL